MSGKLCIQCQKGTFSEGGKVTACTDKNCPENTYSKEIGDTTAEENCIDCASGLISAGGAEL